MPGPGCLVGGLLRGADSTWLVLVGAAVVVVAMLAARAITHGRPSPRIARHRRRTGARRRARHAVHRAPAWALTVAEIRHRLQEEDRQRRAQRRRAPRVITVLSRLPGAPPRARHQEPDTAPLSRTDHGDDRD